MNRWKAQAKRIKPSRPNYVRMACQSLKILIRCRERLMKLAPLLFDSYAIENQVVKRLQAINEQLLRTAPFCKPHAKPVRGSAKRNIWAEAPDLLALVTEKLRAEVVAEAWKNLSAEKLECVKLEWQILHLAATVTPKAWAKVSTHVHPASLSISEIMTVLCLPAEFGKLRRWNVPPQISKLDARAAISDASDDHQAHCPEESMPRAQTDPIKQCQQRAAATYSSNIIRLTTFLSVMHEAEAGSSAGEPKLPVAV